MNNDLKEKALAAWNKKQEEDVVKAKRIEEREQLLEAKEWGEIQQKFPGIEKTGRGPCAERFSPDSSRSGLGAG